jgi:hypothetical protein
LTVLEFFSRMYGVYLEEDRVHFNGLPNKSLYSYTQTYGTSDFKITQGDNIIAGTLNDKSLFKCTSGVSVVTNIKGEFIRLVGIDSVPRNVTITLKGKSYSSEILPNCTYVIKNNSLIVEKNIPFHFPFNKNE